MRLLQLIFYSVIFFLLYKVVKNLLFINNEEKGDNKDIVPQTEEKQIVSDELIKDPICGVFFPKHEGVPLKLKDKKYYFCSEECMRKFLDQNK